MLSLLIVRNEIRKGKDIWNESCYEDILSIKDLLGGLHFLARIFQAMNRGICGCQIPPTASLEKITYLMHNGLGVVIHENAIIGANTIICQNVTIAGAQHPGTHGSAVVGCNCLLGAGAVLIGPISIGNGVKIGANAVALQDIPCNCTAVGVPAKILGNRK